MWHSTLGFELIAVSSTAIVSPRSNPRPSDKSQSRRCTLIRDANSQLHFTRKANPRGAANRRKEICDDEHRRRRDSSAKWTFVGNASFVKAFLWCKFAT